MLPSHCILYIVESSITFYRPPKKFQEGNVFTPVCLSMAACSFRSEGGGFCCQGEMSAPGGGYVDTEVDGMHPSGMHSSFQTCLQTLYTIEVCLMCEGHFKTNCEYSIFFTVFFS